MNLSICKQKPVSYFPINTGRRIEPNSQEGFGMYIKNKALIVKTKTSLLNLFFTLHFHANIYKYWGIY